MELKAKSLRQTWVLSEETQLRLGKAMGYGSVGIARTHEKIAGDQEEDHDKKRNEEFSAHSKNIILFLFSMQE